MAFKLRLTALALEDLDEITAYYVREASSDVANRWLTGVETAAESLAAMPESLPLHQRTKIRISKFDKLTINPTVFCLR